VQTNHSALYVYRIDADDRIEYVSASWIRFAQQNEAAELVQDPLLGKPIWDYIQGREAQLLYRQLFAKLRQSRIEMVIPFRCDSPAMIRHMELVLRSGQGGAIEMAGRLLAAQSRAPVALLDPGVKRTSGSIAICSLCRKIETRSGHWVEIESAITRQRLFTRDSIPRLAERVCPECEKIMTDAAE